MFWNHVLSFRLDFVVFAALSLLAAWLAHRWVRRRSDGAVGLPRLIWLGLTAVLALACFLTETARTRESGRQGAMLGGIAPTYAQELARLGHEFVSHDTPSGDARYVVMIEAQKRWLRCNPAVLDIATFGRRPDGTIVYLVDSETDFDSDGDYDVTGPEARVPIGQVVRQPRSVLVRAFTGRNSFDDAPQLDERGAWLSACVPLADHTGRITAVLRVDYDARAWTMSMFRARGGALGFCGILVAILVGTSSTVTLLRGELARRCRAEQALRESESRLRELALHDRLTGLPNRALLKDRLEQAVIRATRHPDYRFALLFLDFDRFKLVNDSLGHGTGDELLREISARVCRTLRRGDSISRGTDSLDSDTATEWQDLAARLGGDEFVILLDAIRSAADAAPVAQRLLEVLGKPYVIGGHEIHISASMGITVSDARYTNADDMMRDADTAMYHAKDAGGARYTLFDPRMHEMAVNRLTAENDLRRAIQQGHLRLVYQPIVRVEDRQLVGFEALVRWDHPTRGTIEPGEFIPLAEESGLIAPLGAWVLGEACRTLRRWRDQFASAASLTMSVNISRRQFELAGLVEGVCRILNETSIDPTRLILEITESVLMRDTGSAATLLGQLRALGVKVVMDDFGIGHSSLSCLHRFGLNGLKIDRSLIANASGHREYAAVVSAVIMLARNLNMTLVAEGVETDDHLTLLQGMDCDLAQGFYFSMPLSETDAAGWIAATEPAHATR